MATSSELPIFPAGQGRSIDAPHISDLSLGSPGPVKKRPVAKGRGRGTHNNPPLLPDESGSARYPNAGRDSYADHTRPSYAEGSYQSAQRDVPPEPQPTGFYDERSYCPEPRSNLRWTLDGAPYVHLDAHSPTFNQPSNQTASASSNHLSLSLQHLSPDEIHGHSSLVSIPPSDLVDVFNRPPETPPRPLDAQTGRRAPVVCEICGLTLRRPGLLDDHLNTHLGLRRELICKPFHNMVNDRYCLFSTQMSMVWQRFCTKVERGPTYPDMRSIYLKQHIPQP
jgi:hypothetical protein